MFYFLFWALLLMMLALGYQYNRSGTVVEAFDGIVQDCIQLRGSRSGAYFAVVKLDTGSEVKVACSECYGMEGKRYKVYKRREKLGTGYVFTF